MLSRGSRQLAFAAALATALVAFSAAAEANPSKKTKSAPVLTATASAVVTNNGEIASATATCPKGTRAVGGGFTETAPAYPGAVGVLFESQKVGQNQWRASTQLEAAAPSTLVLTTSVYCRKGAPKTTTVSGLAAVQKGGGGVAQASCTGGQKALAGGFAIPTPSRPEGTTALADSFRANRTTWQARALTGTDAGSTVSSFAYCAKLKKGQKAPTEVSATTPTTVTEPTAAGGTATATCTKKKKPLDGGFSTPGTTGGTLTGWVYFVYESLASGSGWRSSAIVVAAGGTFTATLNSIAYCG